MQYPRSPVEAKLARERITALLLKHRVVAFASKLRSYR